MPAVTQEDLEDKLSIFLNTLGEGERYSPGICNGFAFMNFRADIHGKEDENLSRMQKFTDKDDDAVREMGELYKKYKETRRLLIESSPISAINIQLPALQKAKKDQEGFIVPVQEKISTLRAERDLLVNTKLAEKFRHDELEKIHEAEQIYIYLNSLLAAFNPDEYNYSVEGYAQKAYVEMLQLLAPIDAKASEIKINKAFEIAFNFKEKELIDLFSDGRIIHRDDYIALDSSRHTMYLSYRDGVFRLFDPGPIEIKGNTPTALVKTIKDRFFKRFVRSTDYMSIGISIFEKFAKEKAKVSRPEAATLIEAMLAARGPHYPINETNNTWDHKSVAYMAARYGHASVINLLTKAGADLYAPDSNDGNTPLHVAGQNNHPEVIRMLASTPKVDVNARNNIGNTPAMSTASCGHVSAIQALAESKADLNASQTKNGYTPAMFAALHDFPIVIKTLFECGADLNKVNPISGQTPLHIAIQESHFSSIKTLIYCGADIFNIKNNKYKTAMDYAYADKKISSFIMEHYELKQSWEQLQGVIDLTLGSSNVTATVALRHTPENMRMPNLHLSISGCSSAELSALAMTLKNFGIDTELIQISGEQKLVISQIIPGRISIVDFPDFQELYQSNLKTCLKNELQAIENTFIKESKLDDSALTRFDRLTFHFMNHKDVTKEKRQKLSEDLLSIFLSLLDKYVALLPSDNIKEKIEVYKQYQQSPVIKTQRKSGLKPMDRTEAEIKIDAKIEALQEKMSSYVAPPK